MKKEYMLDQAMDMLADFAMGIFLGLYMRIL